MGHLPHRLMWDTPHTVLSPEGPCQCVFIIIINIFTMSIFLNRTWGKLFFSYWASVVVFHLLGHVRLFPTPWTTACQAPLSFTVSWSLLRFMSIESMMPSNHLILSCPLLLLPSIFPSIRVFPSELALHIRWMNIKGWFSLGFTGLVSLHSWDSQGFFPAPHFKSVNSSVLSLLYGPTLTTGKTIALPIQIFVSKVMSLLFNTLSLS